MWVTLYDLENTLGKEAARLLTIYFGGIELYIPTDFKPGHEITKVIGQTPANILAAAYGGRHVTFPNGKNEPKKPQIIDMLEAGVDKKEIARELEVTERYVQHVAKEASILPQFSQLTLIP